MKFIPWAVFTLTLAIIPALPGCAKPESTAVGNPPSTASNPPPATLTPDKDGIYHSSTGLKYQILQPGTGTLATAGHAVKVAYKGTLTDGKVFDQSPPDRPIQFQLGAHQVIAGWDEGIAGMKVGEKRILTIPPELGYGAAGAGGGVIPPNATLVFEVVLVDVQ